MRNLTFTLPFSALSLAWGAVATLLVAYVGLIALVMSYGAHTVELSQSVRDDEAAIAQLEAQYLTAVKTITATDYMALGYAKPVAEVYVPAKSTTALR